MRLANKKSLHLDVSNTLIRSGYALCPQVRSSQESTDSSAPSENGSTSQSSSIPPSFPSSIPFHQKMTMITEGIYLGSYGCATDEMELEKSRITHIINCSPADCPNMFQKDLTYLNINIQDNWKTNLFLVIYIVLDFLKDALQSGGHVLVHCNQGISRSPSIVIAYLIYTQKIPAQTALEYVQQKYPQADPNLDFLIQLDQMYKQVAEDNNQSNSLKAASKQQQQQQQSSCSQYPLAEGDSGLPSLASSSSIDSFTYEPGSSSSSALTHVTISTPDLPSLKLNYDSYKLNSANRLKNKPFSRSFNLQIDKSSFHLPKSRSGLTCKSLTTSINSSISTMIEQLGITESSEQPVAQTKPTSQQPLKSAVKQSSPHFKRSQTPEGDFPTDQFGNFCLNSLPTHKNQLN